ncbi:unnamed protein product [Rhizophagus irregularis]|nr:unnamed protein product [Rhizophagus irregularis]CAB4409363.1 unnamed protein product [Rhizophagus irregularis]
MRSLILTVNKFRKNSLDENPPQNQLTSMKDYTPEQVVLEIGQLRDNEKKDIIINRSLLKIEEQRKEIEDSSCKNELEKAKAQKEMIE